MRILPLALVLIVLLSSSPQAHAQSSTAPTEIALFGPDTPALSRPQFVGELGLVSATGLTGSPSLNLRLGVFVPSLRLSFLVGGNTPYGLGALAAESVFANGDDLEVHWDGEIQAIVRLHLSGQRYTGLYGEVGLGYEAFEVRPAGTGRDAAQAAGQTETVENGFAGVGGGYTVHLLNDIVTLNAGARVVFLFGGPDDATAGGVPIDFRWGFVNPDIRLGVRL